MTEIAAKAVKEDAPAPDNAVRAVAESDTTSNTMIDNESDLIVNKRLSPSRSWTKRQLFYTFVMHGLGGMCISTAANFALAYPMYTVPDTEKDPVKLFALPNTLAGDAAVTIFVQCVLTWFVELGLLRLDMKNKLVQPIGFICQPTKRILRWWFLLPASKSTSAESSEALPLPPRTMSLREVLIQALRGLLIAVVSFLVLWPISVGALTALGTKQGGDWVFDDRWTPQGFKAVLGGMIGLLTTPLMALFWLVRAGWEAEGREGLVQEAI